MLSYLTWRVKRDRRRPNSRRAPVGAARRRGVFQPRNLELLAYLAFRVEYTAIGCEYRLARGSAAVTPHEVFPLVEIRGDGDVEKTHHHLFVGLLAPADLLVRIGIVWILA
jgi:hypothetical protein